jgi:hypothetical protein
VRRRPLLCLAVVLTFAVCAPAALARPGASGRHHRRVCGAAQQGFARCHAQVVTDANGKPLATGGPAGYGPADIQSAYRLPSATAGAGQTVAIVDAYNDPSAESDLAVYRSQFGLPPCTTQNGCFRKVNQSGGTSYPSNNAGWSQEISVDLDAASAACPNCKILLVEASSASFGNLFTAEDEAAALGATEISNSYGGGEFSSETSYEYHYNHPGVAITVSSGDSGYPDAEFPATSRYVTAVGGTTLTRAANGRGWTESAWSGASSGCSAYVPKPSWQTDTSCADRTTADVSAVADPNTGIAVYDSYAYLGASGWLVFGGTSVASPLVAATYALAGNAASVSGGSYAYTHARSLFDVGETYRSRVGSEQSLSDYWRLGEAALPLADSQRGPSFVTEGNAGGTGPSHFTGSFAQPGALFGDPNGALTLGPSGSDYVTTSTDSDRLDILTGSKTWELWFKTTQTNRGIIYRKSDANNANGVLIDIGRFAPGQLRAQLDGGTGNPTVTITTPAATYADGRWHQLAIVLDRTNALLSLYIDGTQAATTSAAALAGLNLNGTWPAYLGFNATSLVGPVDEVALYNAPLDPSTVKDHHYLALNGPSTGSNGSCSGSYLCTAGPAYDGPTGVGSPNGVGGF